MILRRIYMLFPSRQHAETAVSDLVALGIDERHVHTIAKPGLDITGMPKATVLQRSDLAGRIDRWLWDVNLLVFFIALALCVLALWNASWVWAAGCLVLMVLTFSFGYYYTRHIPHAHMTECQTALRHGEILLLVDVPYWRLAPVEKAMRQRHMEIEIGGVGWTLNALGV